LQNTSHHPLPLTPVVRAPHFLLIWCVHFAYKSAGRGASSHAVSDVFRILSKDSSVQRESAYREWASSRNGDFSVEAHCLLPNFQVEDNRGGRRVHVTQAERGRNHICTGDYCARITCCGVGRTEQGWTRLPPADPSCLAHPPQATGANPSTGSTAVQIRPEQ
jgi:hypothetical protein